MQRQKQVFSVKPGPSLVAAAVAGIVLMPGTAAAALANCTIGALSGLGVAGVTVASAVDVPAAAPNPEFCDVRGVVKTTGYGAPDGSAQFEVQLPAKWNQKLLFWGVGGTAGATYGDFAANPVDLQEALAKGYATAITDTGHEAGNTDAAWALLSPGVPNRATLVDYYYRATHQVTVAAKALARAYYGQALKFSYFDGCSNGGRQAMVEATHFPEDYDGIIAGAPFMDIRAIIQGTKQEKAQLRSPDSYIPASMLPAIDQAVYASCDATDGLKDGLIQNPAKCSFDPASLVCRNGATTGCLTPNQAQTLSDYWGALRDSRGRLLYPGASVSDLAGGMDVWTTGLVPPANPTANEPWGGTGFNPAPAVWQFADHIMKYIVERDPAFDLHAFPVSTDGVVDGNTLALFDARTEAGDGDRPEGLMPFIRQGRKLLMFHGLSDPALPPFRTVKYYEDLAGERGGYSALQENVRLFLVPGMQHCVGGPGPNLFDTLSAMEGWAEGGTAPEAIVAAHYVNNNTALGVDRTMPLCKFPVQASYNGAGPVNSAASWSCAPNSKLLDVGADGVHAGLTPPGRRDGDDRGEGDDRGGRRDGDDRGKGDDRGGRRDD